ncbi:MAG: hypothetical protein IEMM0008_1870 [bacterium]|nr:MAG: hypothetical protein IEMM0008_1870 [bacterium]
MNYFTLGIGIAAFVFGLVSIYIRIYMPDKFSKLKLMKETYGEKRGLWIHIIAYTVLPMIAGIIFILKELL